MYNHQGECGVGAVVPWAGRLWVITYAPHQPRGSDDKLYEIDDDLNQTIRPESIGGTPANRMIHRESNQLFIGPYAIDADRNVRAIPYSKMLGRPTANARHLSDPANKIYYYTMEEGLYEVDVHTLDVTTLMKDAAAPGFVNVLPGYHGKGAYSSQGRLVVANNGQHDDHDYKHHLYGPSGTLAEWEGPGHDWHVLMTNQFTEVTGPGGIEGNAKADDPLWSIGWDQRSLILKVLDGGDWYTYRLPVADFSYVASHGWYTEWPRIRKVGPEGQYLMNMHGGWFDFPGALRAEHVGGLAPIGNYLKITGDFANWHDRIIFGCDDTAITGGNNIAGQSHSNLWFTTWQGLHEAGQPYGLGGVWVHDEVEANTPSDPYLLAGYTHRAIHLAHDGDDPVWFTIEVDKKGDNHWQPYANIEVPPHGYVWQAIGDDVEAQWLRVRTNRHVKDATAYLHYGISAGVKTDRAMFAALADVDAKQPCSRGIIRPRGEDMGTLQFLAETVDGDGKATGGGYYEIGADMKLKPVADADKQIAYMKDKAAIKASGVSVDDASVIVKRDGVTYRLPKSSAAYDAPGSAAARTIREVVTERDLLNAGGTIYVLPHPESMSVRGIKPVCTHDKRIADFCSWRGMLVMSGCASDAGDDMHHIRSTDGKVGLWMGDIDDLWRMGKPRGVGGPWRQTMVKAGAASDAYLMAGYDQKKLALSHDAAEAVNFRIEVDVACDGTWRAFQTLSVAPGQTLEYAFPAGYSAGWVRLVADHDCKATATFTYN
ncbi:MAG: hypothetical protein GC162_17095 [Planctomycetes bacterium]|nr:hypothetical protein [Planctomycetota bacterium]